MTTGERTALVVGASGVAGRGIAERLLALGWNVTAVSRSGPRIEGARTLAVDLLDAVRCREAFGALGGTTHIFFAGRHPHSAGVPEPVEENLAMLRNTVEPVEAAARGLRHIHVVHGTKYYGSSTGPFPTPAHEDDPRCPIRCFYYAQEDYIRERQKGKPWSWSISRPHGLLHAASDAPRNLVSVIAAYALICRELGMPFCFPGTEANYRAIYQCTSVDHMSDAILWMAEAPACRNGAFNVTNGDVIRWERLWPRFAAYFGVEPGPVRTMKLATVMADKAAAWDHICARHGLRRTSYENIALWSYGDFVFTPHWDIMSDTTKLRQAGFHACRRTGDEFIRYFDELRLRNVIPAC